MGRVGNSQHKGFKDRFIRWFIWKYQVDLSEAQIEDPTQYETFNAFFTRLLKPGARNSRISENQCASPVDGVLFDFGTIHNDQMLMAKNVSYHVYALLGGSNALSEEFLEGQYMSYYLSPRHYHRVHMPVKGTLKAMYYVPGQFYSVSARAVDTIKDLYSKNERVVCFFKTEDGLMAIVMVGAMFVGSIHTQWHGRVNPDLVDPKSHQWNYPNLKTEAVTLEAGEEMGFFEMGSSVIVLWDKRAYAIHDAIQRDHEVTCGEIIAETT